MLALVVLVSFVSSLHEDTMNCPFSVADSSDCSSSSYITTEENVQEAIRLFTVSTMDAARSGVNQQINLTPDMANEIKVCL